MSSIDVTHDSGREYWRSLDQLADTPEFRALVEREFPSIAEEMDTPASRRTFLKVMGASVALAGMTACRWPAERILPFASRPEDRVPGVPERYATAIDVRGAATGVLVTSFDGRPIKIEGNPQHPSSSGATNAATQAAILGLYDPDRSRAPMEGADPRTWDEFARSARPAIAALAASGGRGLLVVSEASSSPTLARMKARLLDRFPEAQWLEWEPVPRDGVRRGARLAFGAPYRTHLRLDDVRTVVSIDDDFLHDHPESVRYARALARSRQHDAGRMCRLYVLEGGVSLTGTNADRRLAAAPSAIPALAGRLARLVFEKLGVPAPQGLSAFGASAEHEAFLQAAAADLAAARGASVLTVGAAQPAELHALAHHVNAALGNAGATVVYTEEPHGTHEDVTAVRRLAESAAGGAVQVLLVLGANPVYGGFADLDLASAIARVPLSVHLGTHRDETGAACRWHLPRAHVLEAWDDARAWDGTMSVVQPLIEPLWGGKTPAEVLAILLDESAQRGYDLVRETWGPVLGPDFEAAWRRVLHDGVLEGSVYPPVAPVLAPLGDAVAASAARPARAELEAVVRPDAKLLDGRFSNNGWLQELPDPQTKLVWDNAAVISPATAGLLGVAQDDLVRVTVGGRSVELPVHVQPGQPRGTVGLTLGYGRTAAGRVGDGVGANVFALRTSDAPFGGSCTVERTGAVRHLASTQDHFAIDALGLRETAKRAPLLVREADVAEWQANAHDGQKFVEHLGPHLPPDPNLQLWKEFDYDGYKWGMSIDLNACTGCGACTVACQAENNIPVVGREEVRRGREMHWIRIDRYFHGDPDDPEVVHQPVTCQHCENAPCESVCPVAATVHDQEGLNVMVYNRCIGTRYCSNNCPYKVRRFNWFNNHKKDDALLSMIHNPDVTVRSRGVMEKCTFCVQRIQGAKIRAKNERRTLADGEVTTACEQACPTRAIAFGNLNDPASRVARAHASERAYAMLEELNVRPRIRYLIRLRNRGEGAALAPAAEGHHES